MAFSVDLETKSNKYGFSFIQGQKIEFSNGSLGIRTAKIIGITNGRTEVLLEGIGNPLSIDSIHNIGTLKRKSLGMYPIDLLQEKTDVLPDIRQKARSKPNRRQNNFEYRTGRGKYYI